MKFPLSGLCDFLRLLRARTFCSICASRDAGFEPLPDFYRTNAEAHGYVYFGQGEMTVLDAYSCKSCGASDRERLYAWWLSRCFPDEAILQMGKAIHFAPEAMFSSFIKKRRLFSNYLTADLLMDGVDRRLDLMDLCLEDESFDFFICSHVLEHVPDDVKAIKELYRITRKGGLGILMAPIICGLPRTVEDPGIVDESERWRFFGQGDHVRLYARTEYVSRIQGSGFHLHQYDVSYFGRWLFKRLGLKPTSVLYIVEKS